jgi:hypothetical protein
MSPNSKVARLCDTLCKTIVSALSLAETSELGSENSLPEPAQAASQACSDGRLYDWPALQEGSRNVQTAYTDLCAIKTEIAEVDVLSDTTKLDTMMDKLARRRQTLRGSLATLNHRPVATQPTLHLPAQWEMKDRHPGEMGEIDEDGDEIMSKVFWQLLEAIKVQDNPCSRSEMIAVTADNLLFKELHVALGREKGRD